MGGPLFYALIFNPWKLDPIPMKITFHVQSLSCCLKVNMRTFRCVCPCKVLMWNLALHLGPVFWSLCHSFSFLRLRMQFVHSTPFLRSKIMRLSGSSSSRLGGGLEAANSWIDFLLAISVDGLQVVESSLSWTPDLEHEEQSSQASLHRKGCTAVLVALAELRKISITLQHMWKLPTSKFTFSVFPTEWQLDSL